MARKKAEPKAPAKKIISTTSNTVEMEVGGLTVYDLEEFTVAARRHLQDGLAAVHVERGYRDGFTGLDGRAPKIVASTETKQEKTLV